MPEAVGRFRERFPEIELRLRGAGRAEGLGLLDAGDSDLHCGGIDTRGRLPDRLRREPLPALTMGVVAHRNHPLQAGGATAEALSDWPWIDCIADLGPEAGSPSLNDLLDRLHAHTGRRVASIVRAGAAGLGLMASGPYLAWLPLEMLARLPGRPLSPLPPGVRSVALSDRPGAAPLVGEPGAGARPARPDPGNRPPGARLSPSPRSARPWLPSKAPGAWILPRTAFSLADPLRRWLRGGGRKPSRQGSFTRLHTGQLRCAAPLRCASSRSP